MIDLICAQPDKPLFIWQLQVLLTSLFKLNVPRDNIHFLVLLEDDVAPSPGMRELEQYASIYYYAERPEGRFYTASSKPYLFARHWEAYPGNKDRYFLFIESDMLLYRIPELPADEIWYWSDATGYLETGRYEHLLGYGPCATRPFGFHAYGKGVDHRFWYKVESDAQALFSKMVTGNLAGNRWICEMRSWMWNACRQFKNEIHPELAFNDGRGLRKKGATLYHQLSTKGFRKRDYALKTPYDLAMEVDEAFCLHDYISAIREASGFFNHHG